VFKATTNVLLFDYLRVPYTVAERPSGVPEVLEAVWGSDGSADSPKLMWPRLDTAMPPPEPTMLGTIPLFAHVAPADRALEQLRSVSSTWEATAPIVDVANGHVVAEVLTDRDGRIFLPFDPAEAIRACWSEAYQARTTDAPSGRAKQVAMRSYYRLRPLLPRRAQIVMRRAFSRIQARTRFPRWPIEPALHDLYDFLMSEFARIAGEPVPWLAPWPAPYRWALVLTHDVERKPGYEAIDLLADAEVASGFRSSWNLVPERDYVVDGARVRQLQADGFEIGVHGLRHDGRDLESEQELRRRLPSIRSYAERWGAVGFRSPATHRDWRLMPLLGFDYDTSYPDTDPFEPQSGGCCTWWPFFNDNLVELPITLVQDHTAFVILNRRDESLWTDKADVLRERGGMALLITHPDYMLDPARVGLYRRFLDRYADDPTLWKPLPRDVAAWWRRRAATHPERTDGAWRAVGPAAEEACVEHVAAL
jgi:hypothetical protein